MSREKPQKVAEALARYLDQSGLGERLDQVGALDDWAERVGERIADVAEPLHVRGDTLFVAVKSSAWLMELRMMEADIRRRLNEGRDKGRIAGIRFVQAGEVAADEEEGQGRGRMGWGRRGR